MIDAVVTRFGGSPDAGSGPGPAPVPAARTPRLEAEAAPGSAWACPKKDHRDDHGRGPPALVNTCQPFFYRVCQRPGDSCSTWNAGLLRSPVCGRGRRATLALGWTLLQHGLQGKTPEAPWRPGPAAAPARRGGPSGRILPRRAGVDADLPRGSRRGVRCSPVRKGRPNPPPAPPVDWWSVPRRGSCGGPG